MNATKPARQNRASIACTSCRTRRTKCIVPEGKQDCTACHRGGFECIIRRDDQRKRRPSKAYTISLKHRIALLEDILRQSGQNPPLANHPSPTVAPIPREESPNGSNVGRAPRLEGSTYVSGFMPSLPIHSNPSSDDACNPTVVAIPRPKRNDSFAPPRSVRSGSSLLSSDVSMNLVDKVISTNGRLAFDRSSGRLRYYGPTTNLGLNIYSDLTTTVLYESLDHHPATEKIIRDLASDTHDYLMEQFWTYYNSVIHVVHKEAFYEDKQNGGNRYYSGFLHICMLATGYRSADKTRPDIQKLVMGNRESTLHREAKRIFEYEFERPGGLPTVQGLLLFSDLEACVGRDNTGWMISGAACRLAFDGGLNLDCSVLDFPERELQIRHMVLWACVIYDQYWALFLGRPTTIKSSDLAIAQRSEHFRRLGECRPSGPEKDLETLIYEALLDLMDLTGKITERVDSGNPPLTRNVYLCMAAQDLDLNAWYTRLPEALQWTPKNVDTAPFSFFVLHQQYHTTLIWLHRPFAQYKPADRNLNHRTFEGVSHFSLLSRTICFNSAICVSRIFKLHRKRFDTRQIFCTGVQHAGTAASALIAGIAMIQDPKERTEPLEHLHCLVQTLLGMSESYVPVERMCRVINAVIRESGWDVITHSSESDNGPVVPASSPSSRRKSASNDNPQKQLSAGALPPADPSPLTFERQSHSENFSNAKQFPGCEIGSVGPPQIVSRPEDMTGSAVDSFLDPVFFTNDWEIMDTQLDRRDEGSGIGGRTVVGLDLLDLDFGITSGQNFRSSERPGDLPDFWGTILRQLGTSV